MAVDFTMVPPTQRYGELIAHLACHCPARGKAEMMRITELPAADQTGLLGYVFDVLAVAKPPKPTIGRTAGVLLPTRGVLG
jgi:hypothetical protein